VEIYLELECATSAKEFSLEGLSQCSTDKSKSVFKEDSPRPSLPMLFRARGKPFSYPLELSILHGCLAGMHKNNSKDGY
jgi:hypothetical protein